MKQFACQLRRRIRLVAQDLRQQAQLAPVDFEIYIYR